MTNITTILTSVFGGLAALVFLLGVIKNNKRLPLWFAAACSGGAAAAAWAGGFWPMFILGMLAATGIFAAIDVMDLNWRLRCALVVGVSLTSLLVLWPTASQATGGKLPCPAYVKDNVSFRLVAGLDLRGGLRLVYTVGVDEAIKDKRDHYYEDMRRQLAKLLGLHQGDEVPSEETYRKLREKVEVEAPRSPANVIRVKIKEGTDPTKLDERFLEPFRSELSFTRSQDQRELEFKIRAAVESQIRERAVGQAREIIHRRVDELGLREAAVSTRDEDIIIEVPGEDEKSFATIREIISQTARLEFKLLDDETDFFGSIKDDPSVPPPPEGVEFYAEKTSVGLDESGDIRTRQLTYATIKNGPKETSKESLQRLKSWIASFQHKIPPDREIGYELEYRTVDEVTLKQEEAGWRTYFLKSRAEITGDMIRDAQAQPDQSKGGLGGWYVALTFTDQGGSLFEKITAANVKRRFAIILDGRVESAPVIQTVIPGGHATITLGSADPDAQLRDARKLELVLRSGALPAPISPSNEQRIGPSLGRDSIQLAAQGAAGGSVLVLLFMLLYYQRAGFIANFGVVLNLIVQLAVLATFGASMTLPGIAGLALTVGMSVDNNVLINERIREEMDIGKSPRAAVEVGYKRALAAIVDGNVTTVIAGLVLAQYGTGPLKGFAITLMVGVMCNIFTSIVVTRMLFDFWVKHLGRKGQLDMG